MVLPLPTNAASAETIATLGRVLLSTLRGTDAWALLDGAKAERPKKLVVLLPNTPTAQVAGVVQRVCSLLQHHQLALTPTDWQTLPLAAGQSTLAVLSHLSAV